jgi:hypothetical protein
MRKCIPQHQCLLAFISTCLDCSCDLVHCTGSCLLSRNWPTMFVILPHCKYIFIYISIALSMPSKLTHALSKLEGYVWEAEVVVEGTSSISKVEDSSYSYLVAFILCLGTVSQALHFMCPVPALWWWPSLTIVLVFFSCRQGDEAFPWHHVALLVFVWGCFCQCTPIILSSIWKHPYINMYTNFLPFLFYCEKRFHTTMALWQALFHIYQLCIHNYYIVFSTIHTVEHNT